MKIEKVIKKIKDYHKGLDEAGKPIDDKQTRDKVLYGDISQNCTGIVTTCWVTVDVIRKAHELGANLIICHEALFWNHGDHTEWLVETNNKTFNSKKQLLDDIGVVVWRNHDYVHSGVPIGEGKYTDGIFYGFAKALGWDKYITESIQMPLVYEIPETNVEEITKKMIQKFNLNGAKVIGNLKTKVNKVYVCLHVLSHGDNSIIKKAEEENIDLLIALELVDFTVSEYIKDSSILFNDKAIVTLGHFNTEEPGMEYMAEYLKDALDENIAISYVQSGDMYTYVTK